MARSFDEWVFERLRGLEAEGRLRVPDDGEMRRQVERAARELEVAAIDASSNDYLGLAKGVSRETSVQGTGDHVGDAPAGTPRASEAPAVHPGSGASRLVHGSRPEHLALERALADWVQLPDSLLFTSGYAANVGLLTALAGPSSLVVSDQLNHASIIDGCRLSRARVEVVPHLDVDRVQATLQTAVGADACFVVTESYFSMDGDGPDLSALRATCTEYGAWLVVDEAHALGVFGPDGSGRCQQHGIVPDVLVGTLGKAVGSQGAFIAGSAALRQLLWNRARSFVFSTAVSPALAAAALFHVQRARSAHRERQRLHTLAQKLREALAARNIAVLPGSFGPIVPVLVGDNQRAVQIAARLAQVGILTQAIRPPTVPEGTARLRVTVTTAWGDDDPERVASAIARAQRD